MDMEMDMETESTYLIPFVLHCRNDNTQPILLCNNNNKTNYTTRDNILVCHIHDTYFILYNSPYTHNCILQVKRFYQLFNNSPTKTNIINIGKVVSTLNNEYSFEILIPPQLEIEFTDSDKNSKQQYNSIEDIILIEELYTKEEAKNKMLNEHNCKNGATMISVLKNINQSTYCVYPTVIRLLILVKLIEYYCSQIISLMLIECENAKQEYKERLSLETRKKHGICHNEDNDLCKYINKLGIANKQLISTLETQRTNHSDVQGKFNNILNFYRHVNLFYIRYKMLYHLLQEYPVEEFVKNIQPSWYIFYEVVNNNSRNYEEYINEDEHQQQHEYVIDARPNINFVVNSNMVEFLATVVHYANSIIIKKISSTILEFKEKTNSKSTISDNIFHPVGASEENNNRLLVKPVKITMAPVFSSILTRQETEDINERLIMIENLNLSQNNSILQALHVVSEYKDMNAIFIFSTDDMDLHNDKCTMDGDICKVNQYIFCTDIKACDNKNKIINTKIHSIINNNNIDRSTHNVSI